VIRVTDEGELCDIAIALLNQPLPRGNRVGILTIGGGLGVVATEACESSGLEIMQLSSTTIDKLNSYLSSRWSHANPVDIAGTGGANRDAVYSSLWVLMEDDNIDAILLQTPVLFGIDRLTSIIGVNKKEALDYQATQKERLKMVRQRANECGKPVFLVTAVADSDAYSFLQGEGIPIYTSPYRAAKVLQHLYWYNKFLNNSTEE
jgi:acyl-CoA synthetase (NDP forming)